MKKFNLSLFAICLMLSAIIMQLILPSGCKKADYQCHYIVIRNNSIISRPDGPDADGYPLCYGTLVSTDTTTKGIEKTYLLCNHHD